MFATLTSKGQVTVPKKIRDQLQLDTGATLDFQLLPDGTVVVRPIRPDARRIRGVLKSSHSRALSVEEMDESIAAHLSEKHGRRAKPSSR